MTPVGFPHSEIPGSKLVCHFPGLIAAYHVLHRLLVPRHPPCALSSLTGHPSVLALCLPVLTYSIVKDQARPHGREIRVAHAQPRIKVWWSLPRPCRRLRAGDRFGPALFSVWWR